MSEEREEIVQMIEDCENRESALTEWERQFISDITLTIQRGNGLTSKQSQRLEQIWDRVTS